MEELESAMSDWRDDLLFISIMPDHVAIVTVDELHNQFKYSYVHFHWMEWDKIQFVTLDSPVSLAEYEESIREAGFEW